MLHSQMAYGPFCLPFCCTSCSFSESIRFDNEGVAVALEHLIYCRADENKSHRFMGCNRLLNMEGPLLCEKSHVVPPRLAPGRVSARDLNRGDSELHSISTNQCSQPRTGTQQALVVCLGALPYSCCQGMICVSHPLQYPFLPPHPHGIKSFP